MTVAALSTSPVDAAPVERSRLKAAAQQFEAIFVRQMLAEARKTRFGDEQLFGGQGMDTFRQMQDERFADIAAQSGAFGLAASIERQLAAHLGLASAAPGQSNPAPPSSPFPHAGKE